MSGDPIFVEKQYEGWSAPYLNERAASFDLLGVRLLAMPPGRVDVVVNDLPWTINAAPFGPSTDCSCFLNGRSTELASIRGGTEFYAAGADIRLSCANAYWECLVEIDDGRIHDIAAERLNGSFDMSRDHVPSFDADLGSLARLMITGLRSTHKDQLYLEGLAVAFSARSIGLASGIEDDVATRGTDSRIARALDYIGDNLGSNLSVAELAAVACMSPSWFSRAFGAQTGQPVHAYVREQRLEQAMTHIRDGKLPLAEIAFRCGFADQSHMGRQFRKRFGVTPAKARAS